MFDRAREQSLVFKERLARTALAVGVCQDRLFSELAGLKPWEGSVTLQEG